MMGLKKISRLSFIILIMLLLSAYPFNHGIAQPAAGQSHITINYLRWEPSKIVYDKVYEGNAIFEIAGNAASIKSIYVKWIPVKYGQLSENAFPEEDEKTYEAKPVDGKLDGPVEKFSCTIPDIVGGREYDLKVVVEDLAEGTLEKSLRTPYIRQFENTAKKDDLLIGAYYYPWYDSDGSHWDKGYTGSPLLGEYSSRDPVVISKHIDWATGHGIDFFMFSWGGPDSWTDATLKDYFLKNPLANDIKFAIFYESTGRLKSINSGTTDFHFDLSDMNNKNKLNNDFTYLDKQYFSNSNMLKLDDRPVVCLYLARIFKGDVSGAMKKLHNSYDVYLMGDVAYWDVPNVASVVNLINCFDGITAYSMYSAQPDTQAMLEMRLDQKYAEWFLASANSKVDFIPAAMPGYDDRALKDRHNVPIQRSLDRFKAQVGIAKKYMGDKKMYIITSFNEWHEYTSIEPSREYGFSYLEAVK
jgi:hypothetical protein